MATMPKSPHESKKEAIKITVSGQKITDDLTVFRLPGETYNFFVAGGDGYLAQFEDREVFGTWFAVLAKGNNLFVKRTDVELRARIYSQATVGPNPIGQASTTVIVIPPPRPKFPGDLQIVGPGQ